MDISIGSNATIPGIDGPSLIEWARKADERGFHSLGTLDRLVYPNYEPLMALAASAAVTERIGLMTAIAIVPYRANTALFAKQAASLQNMSGGRLTLGMATGAREDDYKVAAVTSTSAASSSTYSSRRSPGSGARTRSGRRWTRARAC